MHADDKLGAVAAASQVLAAAGARQLAACEFEDPEVMTCAVLVHRDGTAEVMLANADGMPVGGYSL